jgi:hypothetical protein
MIVNRRRRGSHFLHQSNFFDGLKARRQPVESQINSIDVKNVAQVLNGNLFDFPRSKSGQAEC